MAGALIGALRVSLSAETANFEAGMKRAQRQTQTSASAIQKSAGLIATSIKGMVAGLSVGLFIGAIKNALDYAGSLTEVAEQLGVTAKDLQTFRFAAGQVGVSQEKLEIGLQKLTISMGKAQVGAKAQADAFKAIGISVDDLKGKDTGEIFRLIADKLQNVADRSKRAAIEVALFGKAGASLDNLLSGAEGKLNDLADAADKLGIVLSDEQIQNADRTADKLEALKTVIAANIAGVVADNADAIFVLADALARLVSAAARVIRPLAKASELIANMPSPPGWISGFANTIVPGSGTVIDAYTASQRPGSSVTVKLPKARPFKGTGSGGNVGNFLAGGESKRKGPADHSAEDALRGAQQFDQDIRRAQMDVLRATQDLAKDYIERTSIGIEILNAEKAAFDSEQQYQVALYKLTKGKEGISQAQADQLKIEYEKKDSLERQLLLQQEQEQRAADVNMLDQHDFDRRKDILQSQEAIATTAAERRKIELELLDIAYQQKKQALEYTIQTSKDIGAVEDARRDLLNLNSTYANDKQGVMNNTRGPLEDYFSQVPKNADQANEAMQRLEVEGIDGALNSIVALTNGFGSFRDAALSAIQQVLAEMLKMQLMKLAFSLFGQAASIGAPNLGASAGLDMATSPVASGASGVDPGLFGSLPGFALGGSMMIGGTGGSDRNVLALNGLPIARVSRGEGLHISPNGMSPGGVSITQHFNGNPTRETMNQVAARTRGAIAASSRAGV